MNQLTLLKQFNMHFKGLQLIRNCVPRQFLYCAFSAEKKKTKKLKDLSDSAQKAIWAQHVIQSILTLPSPTSINDKSLREMIIQLKLQNTGYKLKDKNREEVIKMFEQGIVINKKVYDQTRVENAMRIPDNQIGQEEQTKDDKLIFCPNYSTTRRIFRLLNSPTTNSLIYGGYGISKTIGIIMFSQLVSFKAKLMMEAKKDSKKKKQLEQLAKKKLIYPTKTSKCWYWSIDQEKLLAASKGREKKFLRNLLLLQATELSQSQIQYLEKIQQYQQFKNKLKILYEQAKIPQRVIFDQINYVASKMRVFNNVIQERQKILSKLRFQYWSLKDNEIKEKQIMKKQMKSIKKVYSQKLKNLSQTRESVQKLLAYINEFRFYGDSFIFNSSMNFQLEYLFLTDLLLAKDMLTFNIYGGHKEFYLNRIQYQNALEQPRGKIDFYHFFWFQINRMLSAKEIPKNILEEIKKNFYEKIQKSVKIKRFYRFIFIYQNLMKYSHKFRSIDKTSSKDQIQDTINEIIQTFDANCIQQSIENIKKFIKGRQQQMINIDAKTIQRKTKKIIERAIQIEDQKQAEQQEQQFEPFNYNFIRLLYDLAREDVKMGNKKMSYSVQDLDKFMGENVLSILLSSFHNRQLLPLDINSNSKTIDFLWDPQQFIIIIQRIVDPEKRDFYSEVWNKQSLRYSKQNMSLRGLNIQSVFRDTLFPKTIVQIPIFNKNKKPRPNNNHYKEEDYIKLQIQIFKTLIYPTLTKTSDFFENMKIILSQSKEYPDKWFACQPYIQVASRQKYDSNSPVIDFMFVRYNKDKDVYQIYPFDMTLGSTPSQKQSKIQNLLIPIFNRKVDINQQRRIQINHTILCHRDVIRPPKEFYIENIKPYSQGQQRPQNGVDQTPIIQADLDNKDSSEEKIAASRLIDNKIRICYASFDYMQVIRCFKTTAFKGFKYFQKWISDT